jgi:cell division initiation protein
MYNEVIILKITAMDITNKEFKKVIRGYSAEEVDEFLDKIAEDYEAIYKENSSMKEKLELLTEKVDHYAKMETTIQNTLLLAQNAAEQSKQTAQKESEI